MNQNEAMFTLGVVVRSRLSAALAALAVACMCVGLCLASLSPQAAYAASPYVDEDGNEFTYYTQWGMMIISGISVASEDVVIPNELDENTTITLGNTLSKYVTGDVAIKKLTLCENMVGNSWSKQFKSYSSLEELTLLKGFKMTKQMFGNCANLHTVYLKGDQESLSFNGKTAPGDSPFEATKDITFHIWEDNETLDSFVSGCNSFDDGTGVAYTYDIVRYLDLADADVVEVEDQSYTGSQIKPELVVKAPDGTVLTEGVDYTVAYEDNILPGTATITVTGTDTEPTSMTSEAPKAYRCSGSLELSFDIFGSLKDAEIAGIEPPVYSGQAIEPELDVTFGGEKLMADADYTVEFASNTNAGTATATLTGTGNYTDSTEVNFTIAAAPLSRVNVEAVADQVYTGKAIEPALKVTDGSAALALGTDYTVAFENNTDAGAATATLTGAGYYTGSVKASFKIAPASLAGKAVALSAKTAVFNGSAQAPAVKTVGGANLAASDYKVAYKNASGSTVSAKSVKAAGSYTVVVTGKGNYTGTSKAAKFTIKKAANTMTVKKLSKSVSAKKLKSSKRVVAPLKVSKNKGKVTYAKVKSGSSAKLSINKKTGKVTVKKGTKAGTYKIKVKVKAAGNANYKAMTKTVTVAVKVTK